MRRIKVQGRGQVSVEPDLVTISFDVEAEALEYENCLRNLNIRTDDLRKSMTASGLNKAMLKTTSFNVRVATEYVDKRYVFKGYTSSHRMHIELPMDKSLLNRVLAHVAKGHSGAEISLSFSVKDKDALRKMVLIQAVKTAKENAETLALAAGLKLGQLMEMDYGWSEVHIYEKEASLCCETAPGPPSDIDIEPEDISAENSVSLVYEIV